MNCVYLKLRNGSDGPKNIFRVSQSSFPGVSGPAGRRGDGVGGLAADAIVFDWA